MVEQIAFVIDKHLMAASHSYTFSPSPTPVHHDSFNGM